MKFLFINLCSLLLLNASLSAQNTPIKMDTVSYSLGVLFAQNFKNNDNMKLDPESMAKGFGEALKGKETIPADKANAIFSAFMSEQNQKKFTVNIEKGKAFLAENAKKPGVKVTASGLQYEVIKEGTGITPKATDKVKTHYHGTLLDGKVFDSSVQRGEPIEFPCNGVIQGWQEALLLMKEGSKYKLYVPYNLAYGEKGAGGSIGPYETLIFEVELLKVNP